MSRLRIAMIHLAPKLGGIDHNRRVLEAAVTTAADLGADWVMTPELCLSGYQFQDRIGTDWIVAQPDAWMVRFRRLVASLHLSVFLAHAERDPRTDKLYNTVFVIGPDGALLGSCRKIQVVPVAEDWASAGDTIAPVFVPPLQVGILICADAYHPHLASSLRAQGAQLLVSPAAWPPEPHGPHDAWEARSRETGLPLLVCNRCGTDDSMCFDDAQSVVVSKGKRVLVFSSPHTSVLVMDWDVRLQEIVEGSLRTVRLHESGEVTLEWPSEMSTGKVRRAAGRPRKVEQ